MPRLSRVPKSKLDALSLSKFAPGSCDLRPRQKMDEEETISLEKEIHIMRHIQHPNIVDFYAVYSDAKNIYLVLEYL